MAQQVACTERNAYKVLVGKPEERRPLRRPRLDGRLILKYISEKETGRLDSSCTE
jgi:hypothetical protein